MKKLGEYQTSVKYKIKNILKKKCKHHFESDGGACIKCGKTVADLLSETQKIEMDTCVICGKETIYPKSTHIDNRMHYAEGAGQLCPECYDKVYDNE
jgi:hypothetical protein